MRLLIESSHGNFEKVERILGKNVAHDIDFVDEFNIEKCDRKHPGRPQGNHPSLPTRVSPHRSVLGM